ncbi:hypothetical protein [Methylobacterium sp. E-005]|uniref:hypothetical protein n=1 Tax=Methylobacterium sp. E-005 TaxID=2836549 RepID=UPI001FB9DEC4|nr:hypothetical protein [Methylobacterium sp. E-005]
MPATAFPRDLQKGKRIKPVLWAFPACDHDWSTDNLPVVRAAIGIVSQTGGELIAVQREAMARNPDYAREMSRDLGERIAHFEHLARIMREARERIETVATYVEDGA